MKEQMNRNTLLSKICQWDRVNGCYNGTRDYQYYDCAQLVSKWLDEYDKQIRAKAIDDFVNACEKQFTTIYGQRYIDTRDIKEIAKILKEQKNEQRNNNR